jgi:PAS domain S-box-containing protein
MSLLIFGALALALSVVTPAISRLPLRIAHTPQGHGFVEYFVAYLAICLFFICLRRFLLQRTKEFLLFGLGFSTYAIFQIFQNLSFPGFHNLAWFQPSLNLSLAFDLAARLALALFFLFGILNVNRPFVQPTLRNIGLIYLNSVTAIFLAAILFYSFLPAVFYQHEQATTLKKSLDGLCALLFLACAALLFRFYVRKRHVLYFWFSLAAIFGVFTNLHLGLWETLYDPNFSFGHLLNIFFFSTILFGIFADHFRFVEIEAELRESLEKSKENLEMSEKTFRTFVENMADGFVVTDKNGAIVFCNQTLADTLDYSKTFLTGSAFSKLLPENAHFEALFKDDSPARQLEIEMISRDKRRVPVLLNVARISGGKGEFAGLQAVVTNLSRRKQVERDLENLVKEKTKNIEIFRQCIENSTDGILITDIDGRITYSNRAFDSMTHFLKSELIGKETSVLLCDDRSEAVHEQIWKTVREGRVWRGEFNTRRKDGSGFIGEVAVVPIGDEDGAASNFLWIETDITRRKTLERSLQKYAEELTSKTSELEAAKSYYETLISGMTDILIVVDNEGECTFINDYGRQRLQLRSEDLTKGRLPIFFDDLKRLEKDYGSRINVEIKDFESVIKTRDGEAILCSWHARPLFDRFGRRVGAMAVGRDISEYKKMQTELHEYTKNLENKVKDRTKELQQRVNQLARLLEIGEDIRLNVDVDVILNKICEAVQALGWRRVVISLRDYESRTSRAVAAAGLSPQDLEEVMSWTAIPFEESEKFFKEEFQISNSYFIGHERKLITRKSPHTLSYDLGERQADEWHSLDALLVPIRSKAKILGVISVDDPEDRRRPMSERVRDLEIFADKAALAIENARHLEIQKENERQAKFLVEIGQIFHSSLKMSEVVEAIVTKGGKAIGELCSLMLMAEGENLVPQASYHEKPELIDLFNQGCEKYPCRAGADFVGSVVATGQPLLMSRPFPQHVQDFYETPFYLLNRQRPISSLMILPLRARDRVLGVMVFLQFQPKRKYKHEELTLAQELTDRAALAIENARLFEEAGDKARQLEKANKLKSEFLTNVSHELRTPLNAIITLTDILMRGIPGDLNAEQIRQLQIIQRSGSNLLNLINDILDLSKIEAGKIEPIYSPIPIRAVVEETIEHIRPLCIRKRLELEYLPAADVPEIIFSDQDKLTKALTNVIANAVKFTDHGKISVLLNLQEDKLRIDVSDTGVGIPENRLEDIFKEFQQVDSSDSRKYGGTGLGLTIARKMLTILGGSISVVSQVGKGSTFTILLPLKTESEIAEAKRFDSRRAPPIGEFELEVSDDRDRLDARKKVVLIIDDEKEAIYIMQQYLHEHDYQIIFPQNGENVLELAELYSPFVITLDILMPAQSGWEVLDLLKSDERTKEIPVVVTSILQERERALAMGAAEYLVKPFEPQKLLAVLAALDSRALKPRIFPELPDFSKIKKALRAKLFFPFSQRKLPELRSRILLVDDDKDTQYAMKYILEQAGYQVYFANEGGEALQQAQLIKPNLILMDIMMPEMDGYEATRQLKAHHDFKNIPIIAMTAKAMKGDREKILLAGCDDYIAKPFMTKEILQLVEKWLQQSLN